MVRLTEVAANLITWDKSATLRSLLDDFCGEDDDADIEVIFLFFFFFFFFVNIDFEHFLLFQRSFFFLKCTVELLFLFLLFFTPRSSFCF